MDNKKSYQDNPDIQKPKQYQPNTNIGRQYIFGYTKCIRNTNLAVMDLFSDITILNDNDNQLYSVPIIFGTQEKAAIYAFGEQFAANPERKENGLVDRIRIPIVALMLKDINFDEKRYIYHEAKRKMFYGQEKINHDIVYRFAKGIPVNFTYNIILWAKYYEHLMQMVEQIMQKFSPIAYINVEGIYWETPVKITGSNSNINEDVADRQVRILKYIFSFVVEGHIMQPIKKDKTILKITQKNVILGDLTPSAEIENIITEPDSGQIPEI